MARYDGGWRGEPGGGEQFWNRGGGAEWGEMMSPSAGLYGPGRYGLGPYHQRLRTRRRPDDELRTDVQDALFYDTWVDADAITVAVEDGIVTLSGELPDYEEIRYATDDAWDVEGVLGVRSELRLRAK
jgi:hypothetical protein